MTDQNKEVRRNLVMVSLASLIGLLVGCQQGQLYYPSTLPQDFMAPRTTALRHVDLSRISRTNSDSEIVYPGDIIAISISTGLEAEKPTDWKGRVDENGVANVPLVGPVAVAGLRLTEAELAIRDESIRRGKFVNPNVTVRLDARRANRVTVIGAVKKPGTYDISTHDSNVLAAIIAADGLADDAGTIVDVKHPDLPQYAGNSGDPSSNMNLTGYSNAPAQPASPRFVRLDLGQASTSGQGDFHVEDGSTVMVMSQPKRYVHVIGLVQQPGQFEMLDDHELKLLDAIAMANGRKLEVADKVRIIRTVPGRNDPVYIEASIKAAKSDSMSNIRLAPGDVVSVEETTTTLIVGTFREFIRFGFTSAIPGF